MIQDPRCLNLWNKGCTNYMPLYICNVTAAAHAQTQASMAQTTVRPFSQITPCLQIVVASDSHTNICSPKAAFDNIPDHVASILGVLMPRSWLIGRKHKFVSSAMPPTQNTLPSFSDQTSNDITLQARLVC
jgi:hypothetical protein